jgi:perosamine synthetase
MNTRPKRITPTQSIPKWIQEIKNPQSDNPPLIPIYSPYLAGNEKKYVNECLDTKWISSKGPFVRRFEEAFAQYCNCPYAVACNSGTSALFLALVASGIKKGDEVIVPTFTMISTAFAVTYTGATPVFVDADPKTGNIDISRIEEKISTRTKAILPVHIYGTPCRMDEITGIALKHNLIIIEDGAEALGSSYKEHKVGSISQTTAFSLYSNKVVTSGDGGMITTKSQALYKKLKHLNSYAFSDVRHFWHDAIGYSLRLTNLEAAIGLAQIEHIESTLKNKQHIEQIYRKLLSPIAELFKPFQSPGQTKNNYWMIAYRLHHKKLSIQALRNKLMAAGIETRSFFIPLHLQPIYRSPSYMGKFPNSEMLTKSGVLLPSYPTLLDSEIEYICKIIRSNVI